MDVGIELQHITQHGRLGVELGTAVGDGERLHHSSLEPRGSANDDERIYRPCHAGIAIDHDERIGLFAGRQFEIARDENDPSAVVESFVGGDSHAGETQRESHDGEEHDELLHDGLLRVFRHERWLRGTGSVEPEVLPCGARTAPPQAAGLI